MKPEQREQHHCCLKKRLCTEDHYHERDVDRLIADERERIAREIEAAFPLPTDDEPAPCTAGHDCHAAARYTTGRLAAGIARGQQ